ncbi:hypothetical protein GCK32_001794 [Trichostrongylus colubriformis]|uniref:Uncharacterized protein n=1 Tax=Trichostrongylus colubriformis TaxID=6319 RepID=A0AAN8EZX5_TRICO
MVKCGTCLTELYIIAIFQGNLGLVLNESVSTSNLQPIEVVPVVAAGIVFGILTFIGSIATVIFIAVLIRGRKKFAEIFTLSSTVLPIVMLVMYGIIFIVIIKKRTGPTDTAAAERDRSLLWQALAVTVMLELTKLTSMITPFLAGADPWAQWVWTIFSYSTSILNQMINPLLFLTMNKMVRSILRNFFRPGATAVTSDLSEMPKRTQARRPVFCRRFRKISRLFVRPKKRMSTQHELSKATWVF